MPIPASRNCRVCGKIPAFADSPGVFRFFSKKFGTVPRARARAPSLVRVRLFASFRFWRQTLRLTMVRLLDTRSPGPSNRPKYREIKPCDAIPAAPNFVLGKRARGPRFSTRPKILYFQALGYRFGVDSVSTIIPSNPSVDRFPVPSATAVFFGRHCRVIPAVLESNGEVTLCQVVSPD